MATVLLIADIGGYTRYMAANRVALTHAHYVVGRLLETVIDAGRPWLKLSKLEGDAALFWADERELDPQRLPECVTGMREAFVRRRAIVDTDCICNCDACVDTRGLTLKFVAHLGEVAFQRVKRFTELAGIDVILVHRMLKNEVPAREYLLMTEPLARALPATLGLDMHAIEQDFEGLGRTPCRWIDLSRMSVSVPARTRSLPLSVAKAMLGSIRTLPYGLGIRRPCAGFKNLPEPEPPPTKAR
jgi:uncharacterized protein DUF2652